MRSEMLIIQTRAHRENLHLHIAVYRAPASLMAGFFTDDFTGWI